MTRLIDAHVHLFDYGYLPRSWYERAAERWAAATWPRRDPNALDVEGGLVDSDGSALIGELDSAGIDAALCLALDWGVEFNDPSISMSKVHGDYARMQDRHRGRLFGVAGVDPRRPDAIELLDEAIGDFHLKGLKIYPPCGYYPSDPVCFPLYQRCIELGVPVVIHTAYVGYPHVGKFANPLSIGEVQVAFPDLTIVLAHAGHEIWAQEAMEIASYHPDSYLEISNWNWNLQRDEEQLVRTLIRMRDTVGAHRMLFASDHLGGRRFSGKRSQLTRWTDFIRELPERAGRLGLAVSAEEMELILHANAERVFRLPA